MKKIVFLIDSLDGGGAEKILLNIVKNIDKKKYEVDIITIFNRGVYIDEVRKYSNYSYSFQCKKNRKTFLSRILIFLMTILSPRVYYNLLIKGKYDVEIAFLEGICTKIISGSTNRTSKKIAWVHTDLINHPNSSKKYLSFQQEKKAYDNFDKIICVSGDSRHSFEQKFRKYENVTTIYNPINAREIKEYSEAGTCDEIEGSFHRVIAVGRLDKNKSFDRLIRATERIIAGGLKFNLYILGTGVEEVNLATYIKENGLSDYIHLLGFIKNPYPYIRECDFLVNSSFAEGYNTAIAEALILEKPVVATKTSGVSELFGDFDCGIITENSEEGLYKGIKKMLTDDKVFSYYKKETVKRASEFNISEKMLEISKVFEN